jgi:hypothetical protein
MIKIPEDVAMLLVDIAKMNPNYEVYLGGGYLRDLYCGLIPKDVDVFFSPINNNYNLDYLSLKRLPLQPYPNTLKHIYTKSTTSRGWNKNMTDRKICRLVGLQSLLISPNQVQYITYSECFSQQEITLDFDMNICQITWHPLTNKFWWSDEFVEGHKRKYIECLHQYDSIRMWHRYERMESKFPDYLVIGKTDIDSDEKKPLPSQEDYQDSV